MIHSEALQIAERIKSQLAPHCDRIEIAGSIRRQKPEVKDIEIVCIPKPYENNGMFVSGIAEVVNDWEKVKGELGPECKYTQRVLPEGIKLDLFFATKGNWGWIYALRTGSADFNFKYLDAIKKKGYRADGGQIVDRWGKAQVVETEEAFFDLIDMEFISPEYRVVI